MVDFRLSSVYIPDVLLCPLDWQRWRVYLFGARTSSTHQSNVVAHSHLFREVAPSDRMFNSFPQ